MPLNGLSDYISYSGIPENKKNPSRYNHHPNRRGRETHLRVVDFSSSCSCVFTKSEGKLIDISIIPLIAPAGTIQMMSLTRKFCRNKEITSYQPLEDFLLGWRLPDHSDGCIYTADPIQWNRRRDCHYKEKSRYKYKEMSL